MTAFVLSHLLGNLWDWLAGVGAHMADVSVYWLVLALVLKTAESALIAVGWRNILHAAYPSSNLSFKTAWGASQGGTAINAVMPAQAGTAAMIGIFRRNIPGSSVAGVTSATVVQSLFFTAVSVVVVIATAIFRPRVVSKGSPSNETGGFFASHPLLVAAVIVAVVAVLFYLWPRLKPRLLATWKNVKQGAAIFQDRRRYLERVALPSAGSYGCRIGVNIVFMVGFGIPVTLYTAFLVASSHMLSQIFAITPGGVGQTQALDVVTLRKYASSGDVAAFSVTQDAVMTIWNVVLGLGVSCWAFGFGPVKQMLLRRGSEPAAETS